MHSIKSETWILISVQDAMKFGVLVDYVQAGTRVPHTRCEIHYDAQYTICRNHTGQVVDVSFMYIMECL